ncbi:MAG: hypothetical protein ACI86H_000749 [bacterium]
MDKKKDTTNIEQLHENLSIVEEHEESQEEAPLTKHEKTLLSLIDNDDVREKIKDRLKESIQKELSSLSPAIKGALKNWIQKEKEKLHFPDGVDLNWILGSKRSLEVQLKISEGENSRLRKQLLQKDQENKLIIESIQALYAQLEKK